jgi:hypothetical protein
MPIPVGHRRNFDTLRRAFLHGDALLLECALAATGEQVAVVCAAQRSADGLIEFVPFAQLFNDNPYRVLNPPRSDGPGFVTQGEMWPEITG